MKFKDRLVEIMQKHIKKSLSVDIDIFLIHGIYVLKTGKQFMAIILYSLQNGKKIQIIDIDEITTAHTKGKDCYLEAACNALTNIPAARNLESGLSSDFEFKELYLDDNELMINEKSILPDFAAFCEKQKEVLSDKLKKHKAALN